MSLEEKQKIIDTYQNRFGTPFHMNSDGIDDDDWIAVLKKCLRENREWTEKDMGFSDDEIELIKTGEIVY